MKPLELRLQRIEAALLLEAPPTGWITPEKIKIVRDRLGYSIQEAKAHLISNFGDEKL